MLVKVLNYGVFYGVLKKINIFEIGEKELSR